MPRRTPVRRNTNPWKHADGFGAYVEMTRERRHPVPSVWNDATGTYCAECAFPVVPAKIG